MTPPRYAIARARNSVEFFTATSSYDRPKWTSLQEASVYFTPEHAQKAALSLAKSGAYECRVIALAEDLPAAKGWPPKEGVQTGPEEVGTENKTEMVANKQDVVCDVCEHTPCTCGEIASEGSDPMSRGDRNSELLAMGHKDGYEDMPPQTADKMYKRGYEYGKMDREDSKLTAKTESSDQSAYHTQPIAGNGALYNQGYEDALSGKSPQIQNRFYIHGYDNGQKDKQHADEQKSSKRVAESILPSDDKVVTAPDVKLPEVIKYHTSANVFDIDNYVSIAADSSEKIKVPTNIISDLKAAISQYQAKSKQMGGKDDASASFFLTVCAAFENVLQHLEVGTNGELKQAQISMSSWMNPILSLVPQSVQKYVYSGGRKQSLKDSFYDRRATIKEAAEVPGNDQNMYDDYAQWKKACKDKHTGCTFTGNTYVGSALLNNRVVGEWDNTVGEVYGATGNPVYNIGNKLTAADE